VPVAPNDALAPWKEVFVVAERLALGNTGLLIATAVPAAAALVAKGPPMSARCGSRVDVCGVRGYAGGTGLVTRG